MFEYFLANLGILLPWQPIKFSGLDKIKLFGRGLFKKHFFFFFFFGQNIRSEIERNTYCHFSLYKSCAQKLELYKMDNFVGFVKKLIEKSR